MRQLPQIRSAYDWFFAQWQSEAARVVGLNDLAALTRLEEKRDTLERGVFVLMFGQFEVAVNEVFQAARTTRIGSSDWTYRRG